MWTHTYRCAKCGITKPKTEFHRRTKSAQGVVSRCKLCIREDGIAKRESRREYERAYRQRNREQLNERQRIKNRNKRHKRNELKQAWRSQRPMDYKRTVVNANAKRYGAAERISLHALEALWEAQVGTCPFTLMPLEPRTAVLHHLVSLADGGSNTLPNMIFTTRQVHFHKQKRRLSTEAFCAAAGLDYDAVMERIRQTHKRLAL